MKGDPEERAIAVGRYIAGLVGYGDVYAFSKQFSRFFGFPPGKYRARLHTDAPDLEQF